MLNSEDQDRLTRLVEAYNGEQPDPEVAWAVDQLRKADETCRNLVNAIAFWRSVLKQAL